MTPFLMNSPVRSIASCFGASMASTKMHAGLGHGQHLREKNALVDFDAVLLALQQRAFGLDLLARRSETRHQLRRLIDKFVHTHECG